MACFAVHGWRPALEFRAKTLLGRLRLKACLSVHGCRVLNPKPEGRRLCLGLRFRAARVRLLGFLLLGFFLSSLELLFGVCTGLVTILIPFVEQFVTKGAHPCST